MKRLIIIGFLCILNITFSSAVFLQKPLNPHQKVITQLKKIEKHSFGKRIIDIISLQVTSKVPLGEVAKVISEIKSDLKAQQRKADNLIAERSQQCEEEEDRLTSLIDQSILIKSDALDILSVLGSDIKELSTNIDNKNGQLQSLKQRVSDLSDTRSRDNEAFQARSYQTQQVIDALNLIVDKVSEISPESSEKEALLQLSKIGRSNPILSLVSIASTFSSESLSNVINKLTQLRDSLQASIEEDEEAENKAINEFNNLLAELNTTVRSISILTASLTKELNQKQASNTFQTNRLNNALDTITTNTDILDRKKQQCTTWNDLYATQTSSRSNELKIINDVQNIIATKLETMKDYLRDRAEQ